MNSLNDDCIPAERAASQTKASYCRITPESNNPGTVKNAMRHGRRQVSKRCYRDGAIAIGIELKRLHDGQRYKSVLGGNLPLGRGQGWVGGPNAATARDVVDLLAGCVRDRGRRTASRLALAAWANRRGCLVYFRSDAMWTLGLAGAAAIAASGRGEYQRHRGTEKHRKANRNRGAEKEADHA